MGKIDGVGWTAEKIKFIFLVKLWLLNLARVFMDIDFDLRNPLTYLILPIFALVVYSIYFLGKNAPRNSWLFILILIGATTLPFLLQDLVLGGRRTSAARFLTPLFLAIQINIAYLIAHKTDLNYSNKNNQVNFWNFVLAAIITIGIASGFRICRTNYTWNKYDGLDFIAMAEIINSSSEPLVIDYSTYSIGVAEILTLSHLLKADVYVYVASKPNALELLSENINSTNLFLIEPPQSLKNKLNSNPDYKIKSAYQGRYKQLYKIEK